MVNFHWFTVQKNWMIHIALKCNLHQPYVLFVIITIVNPLKLATISLFYALYVHFVDLAFYKAPCRHTSHCFVSLDK